MSAETQVRSNKRNALTSAQLPRFIDLYVLAGAVVVSAAVMGLLGFNISGFLVLIALFYIAGISVLSAVMENRRKAMDRFVRGVIVVFFLLAMAPLASLLWEVFSRGLKVMSWNFLTTSGGISTLTRRP